jgi:hypothetical protein
MIWIKTYIQAKKTGPKISCFSPFEICQAVSNMSIAQLITFNFYSNYSNNPRVSEDVDKSGGHSDLSIVLKNQADTVALIPGKSGRHSGLDSWKIRQTQWPWLLENQADRVALNTRKSGRHSELDN